MGKAAGNKVTLYDRVVAEEDLDEGWKERVAGLALATCLIGSPGCSSTGHRVGDPSSFAEPSGYTHRVDKEADEFFRPRALEASKTARALGQIQQQAPGALQKASAIAKQTKVDPRAFMLPDEKQHEEPETSETEFVNKLTQNR